MSDMPETIYLQKHEGFEGDYTWCRDQIHDDDVQYIRADTVYAGFTLRVLADIRHKTGVGHKPMLTELADELESRISKLQQERDEALEALKWFMREIDRAGLTGTAAQIEKVIAKIEGEQT